MSFVARMQALPDAGLSATSYLLLVRQSMVDSVSIAGHITFVALADRRPLF
jgi:hypothetical protein